MTWRFKPEPRSFQVVAKTACITLTRMNDSDWFVAWFYDRVIAEGSRAVAVAAFNRFAHPNQRLT